MEKIEDVLKKEPEKIKQIHNSIINNSELSPELEDMYYYAYHKVSGKEPSNPERYNQLMDRYEEKTKSLMGASKIEGKGGQYVAISFQKIDDYEWRCKHRDATTLYLLLRRYVVRNPSKFDRYDIYNRYFMDNKLAVAISLPMLAKMFGYKNGADGHIVRMLKQLEKEGAFRKEYVYFKDEIEKNKLKKQAVYVLGEWKAGKKVWYYDSGWTK